jgi:hypothetical protein
MSASLPSRDEQSQLIPLFQDEPRDIRLAVMLYILFPLSLRITAEDANERMAASRPA